MKETSKLREIMTKRGILENFDATMLFSRTSNIFDIQTEGGIGEERYWIDDILMKFHLEWKADLLSTAKNSQNLLSIYYNECGNGHREIISHLRIIIKLTNRYY